jgi:hypothetical protein
VKLIQYRDNESDEIQYFWVNSDDVTVSPRFPRKTLALEWFSLHEEWMEDSTRDGFANLMYIKSNN